MLLAIAMNISIGNLPAVRARRRAIVFQPRKRSARFWPACSRPKEPTNRSYDPHLAGLARFSGCGRQGSRVGISKRQEMNRTPITLRAWKQVHGVHYRNFDLNTGKTRWNIRNMPDKRF